MKTFKKKPTLAELEDAGWSRKTESNNKIILDKHKRKFLYRMIWDVDTQKIVMTVRVNFDDSFTIIKTLSKTSRVWGII